MKQNLTRLQYSISNWSQAAGCLSNNSKDLHITIAEYRHNTDFEGQIISVVHTKFGTMFASVTNGSGVILSVSDEDGKELPLMTTAEVLVQLEKFGFDIEYKEEPHLSGEQLTFLTHLHDLGYDAITKVKVVYPKTTRVLTIAYDSEKTLEYLSFGSSASKTKIDTDLESGAILNVAKMNKDLEWDWLTYTCQIEDLLRENSIVHHIGERSPEIEPNSQLGLPETIVEDSNEEEIIAPPITADPSGFHVYGAVEILGYDADTE